MYHQKNYIPPVQYERGEQDFVFLYFCIFVFCICYCISKVVGAAIWWWCTGLEEGSGPLAPVTSPQLHALACSTSTMGLFITFFTIFFTNYIPFAACFRTLNSDNAGSFSTFILHCVWCTTSPKMHALSMLYYHEHCSSLHSLLHLAHYILSVEHHIMLSNEHSSSLMRIPHFYFIQ